MSHPLPYELTAHNANGHPLELTVVPALEHRNRLTSAFRIILAIPHLVLVGGPVALALCFVRGPDQNGGMDWTAGGGILGGAAIVISIIAWFAIMFTGRMPEGLWNFSAFYLRWRVRVAAYVTLLGDEYPPFGDERYFADLSLARQPVSRDRVSVAFRVILALPHIFLVWLLGIAWLLTSVWAWFAILLTGKYPPGLYDFAVGVLRWSTSVEAYLLLLHDEFPPFSLSP